jgi:hypothetical protein
MVSHCKTFADVTGDRIWYDVRDETYSIINRVRGKYSPQTSLMPDFIVGLPSKPRPVGANFLEGPNDGAYSWNAARYPWRIAVDYLLNDDQRALAALKPLNSWIKRTTDGIRPRSLTRTSLTAVQPPKAIVMQWPSCRCLPYPRPSKQRTRAGWMRFGRI